MKTRLFAVVIVLCLVLSMAFTVFAAPLTDIENHWAKEQIKAWVEKGLVKGYEDGTFRPDHNISRAEFMALVNRAFNYQEKAEIDYKDVKEGAWYSDVVKVAKSAGYISGYEDGTVKLDNPVSRQEAATMIMKILSLKENTAGADRFQDAAAIPAWSKGAVGAVASAGIMGGYPDGNFRADNFITRAEAVVALEKALSSKAGVIEAEVIYDEAGIYGPDTGSEATKGNVIITAANVTLQSTVIEGNLTIDRAVGDGDVYLKKVTVKGDTYIYGGGKDSIYFIDSQTGRTFVLKDDGPVRIVISGTTAIEELIAQSGVTVEEVDLSGEGVEGITVDKKVDGDIEINLRGVNLENLEINTPVVSVNTDKNTTINYLTANAKAEFRGPGTIKNAVINADGVTFERMPEIQELGEGVKPPATRRSGGGGSSKNRVSAISITTDPGDVSNLPNNTVVTVTLETATSGASIYYTLDGTTPTKDSTLYEGPFAVTAPGDEGGTVTIKAVGIKPGYTSSTVVTKEIKFNAITGRIEIIGVEPDENLEPGKETEFTVEVAYEFDGIDKAILYIGFNTEEVDQYKLAGDGHVVEEKAGTHTFEVKAAVKDWGEEGKFKVYVDISKYPHPGERTVLDYDTYELKLMEVPVSEVSVEPAELIMAVGRTEKITATISPPNATNKKVNWSSSDENVATVDENGYVTAVAPGTATITATTEDGGKKATCEVTVSKVVNVTKKKGYDTIQEAIDDAGAGDTIQVGPGTYHGKLIIAKSLTLLGPNAGVPGYSAERGPEAILTVEKDVDLENPKGSAEAVITVRASEVTIDGLRITGDNGNGKINYAGCNIQAGTGIAVSGGGKLENLTVQNNIFDCFSMDGVFINRRSLDVWLYGPIENVTVTGNLVQNIHDLGTAGYGYGIYMQGATGSITGNVVKNSRVGIMVEPYGATGGGLVEDSLVKDNYVEAYVYGMIYYNGAGTRIFEDNTFKAIDPPDGMEGQVRWRGIAVGYFDAGVGPVYFRNNIIDGSGTSVEHPYRSAVFGVHIRKDVKDGAEMIFEGNTITGVQIGLKGDGGNLNLDNVLDNNTFDPGSTVIGNNIRLPQGITPIYNVEKNEYYFKIQEAIEDADDGDTIQVGPGTYHEKLIIDKSLTLLGPNAGVPGYSAERRPEAILTVPKQIDLENPEGNTDAVITVYYASGVTIDGFRITGDNGNGKINYAGCNIQAGRGICVINIYMLENITVQNNIIDCFSRTGMFTTHESIGWKINDVTIAGNLFQNIHDLREAGSAYGIYLIGTNGSITGNVVKNCRSGIVVDPRNDVGDGLVKKNNVETYVNGILYYNGAGEWTFEENTVKAIDPPGGMEGQVHWRGIAVNYLAAGMDPVYFKDNTVDGSGTTDHAGLTGIVIGGDVQDDAEMIFEGNTITGVQIGLRRDGGNLNLDDVLDNNTFDPGSVVIGNTIQVPQVNAVYNVEKGKYYENIQEAIDEADPGDTIQVAPGTYHGYLTIEKSLTLLGPNAGVPGYSAERGAEAIITVPEEVDLENPEGNEDAVITVKASGVTIDGFQITGDNGNGKIDYAGCNIQAGDGIAAYSEGKLNNLTFQNNIFDCLSFGGVNILRDSQGVKDYGTIENVTVTGNLVQNIHDLRPVGYGYGYGIVMMGANGRVTANVVKTCRVGIMVLPYSTGGGGLVQDNDVEAYVYGLICWNAESGAGSWIFEENTVKAIDPPDGFISPSGWFGISVEDYAAGACPVNLKNNTVDGSGTSIEHPSRSEVIGIKIREDVQDDAEMIFEGNTITGVQIGLRRDGGNLNLEDVLANNNFDPGSMVIGNTIQVAQENAFYDVEKHAYYDIIHDDGLANENQSEEEQREDQYNGSADENPGELENGKETDDGLFDKNPAKVGSTEDPLGEFSDENPEEGFTGEPFYDYSTENFPE
ncbi:MAG TPA: S-layer homology domain-containing protein [Bacillota bacterium]|nr:S-layer homology domain-containing protein [Peptococcaceae bacterium MAG4]HQD76820.1 S-layer homology domain-containing protein [Bacillota bacterium]HUM59525.1 S-layer homology domain-containing protein [Bacillota bacterium]